MSADKLTLSRVGRLPGPLRGDIEEEVAIAGVLSGPPLAQTEPATCVGVPRRPWRAATAACPATRRSEAMRGRGDAPSAGHAIPRRRSPAAGRRITTPPPTQGDRPMKTLRFAPVLCSLALALSAAPSLAAELTLKASHQFPGGKGDVRDEMVQMIARDVAAANVGLTIKVFPGSSLVKPKEQWKAMLNGQIDLTSLPLDYASGFHPQFGATLMPGLVKSHAHAQRINASPFMQDIKAIIEKGGVKVLADAWLAGAFGGKDKCIRAPADVAGMKIRSAGSTFAEMWAGAGASIVSIPSSEVYNALQQGVAQGTDTSSGSFVSFRLYEQLKCLTAPGDNALWFMYEPVLMSMKSWNKLDDAQKKALADASAKAQAYFEGESKKLDDKMVETFKKNGVEVIELSDADADAWREVAKKTSYKNFADQVPGGKELIEKALSVK
jgi:TRAP-type C4-dicarboxylate transport system substrate-binding protein